MAVLFSSCVSSRICFWSSLFKFLGMSHLATFLSFFLSFYLKCNNWICLHYLHLPVYATWIWPHYLLVLSHPPWPTLNTWPMLATCITYTIFFSWARRLPAGPSQPRDGVGVPVRSESERDHGGPRLPKLPTHEVNLWIGFCLK